MRHDTAFIKVFGFLDTVDGVRTGDMHSQSVYMVRIRTAPACYQLELADPFGTIEQPNLPTRPLPQTKQAGTTPLLRDVNASRYYIMLLDCVLSTRGSFLRNKCRECKSYSHTHSHHSAGHPIHQVQCNCIKEGCTFYLSNLLKRRPDVVKRRWNWASCSII